MQPNATIFAGVNGSGKTTLYYNELEKGRLFGLRVNIDEIVSSFGDWRSEKDQTRATKIALRIRKHYIQTHQSFNQETTLCGASITKLFSTLKANNYAITLYYVGLDSVEKAKQRVKIRVAKGGHDIDSKLIERRFCTSLQNLKAIAPLSDDVLLFDNSAESLKLIAQKHQMPAGAFNSVLEGFITERLDK
ncbi:zeta toxin family protein [Helicobacter zhangjianzhongii]|uniref:zeta toxin family protein n=1 Tax=Helicobacter zhangjianzhongii TaxID=2974574 RepID=UPI002554C9BC|nr:zeta toxin family protein [Helicobacter sp. CPD2-1]MDL0080993.1 zeta toxin family protein [Helicobacter sp. CPD2-1]